MARLTIHSSQSINCSKKRILVNTTQSWVIRPERPTRTSNIFDLGLRWCQDTVLFGTKGTWVAADPRQLPLSPSMLTDADFPCCYSCPQPPEVCQLAQWWVWSPRDTGSDFCRKMSLIPLRSEECLFYFWNTWRLTDTIQCWQGEWLNILKYIY